MTIQTDGSGNTYIESNLPNGEAVRVSFIEKGWTESACIRINLRDIHNHIRQGAEFPIDNIEDIVSAIIKLIKK